MNVADDEANVGEELVRFVARDDVTLVALAASAPDDEK